MAVTRSAHNKANNKSRNPAKQVAAKQAIPKKATRKGIKLARKLAIEYPIIYKYVLVKENGIEIISPLDTLSRLHLGRRKRKPPKGAAALLQVSKAVHHDTAQYFYENDHFVIRLSVNALHRLNTFSYTKKSFSRANSHGLKCFLTRVPRLYVSCIKELTILISFALYEPAVWSCDRISYGQRSSGAYIPTSVARQFQDMTTVKLRRFFSLRVVNIIFNDIGNEREPVYSLPLIPQPSDSKQSIKVVPQPVPILQPRKYNPWHGSERRSTFISVLP